MGKRCFFMFFFFFTRGDAQKPHPKPLSELIIFRAVVLLLYKWGWSFHGGVDLNNTLPDCHHSVSLTRLTYAHLSSTSLCLLSSRLFPVPHLCPSLHLLYCFLSFLSLTLHLSSLCPATSPLPPSLQIFIILPLPPIYPLLSSLLLSPTRFVMVLTSQKKKKIFPLHSNAPPHYCSLCCHWCGRRGRDVKLHQRRLHIASAHFSCCQPWPGNNSFSPHTLCLPSPLLSFIFFFVSCLSVHFSVPLQNYKKKKREKRNE